MNILKRDIGVCACVKSTVIIAAGKEKSKPLCSGMELGAQGSPYGPPCTPGAPPHPYPVLTEPLKASAHREDT